MATLSLFLDRPQGEARAAAIIAHHHRNDDVSLRPLFKRWGFALRRLPRPKVLPRLDGDSGDETETENVSLWEVTLKQRDE